MVVHTDGDGIKYTEKAHGETWMRSGHFYQFHPPLSLSLCHSSPVSVTSRNTPLVVKPSATPSIYSSSSIIPPR